MPTSLTSASRASRGSASAFAIGAAIVQLFVRVNRTQLAAAAVSALVSVAVVRPIQQHSMLVCLVPFLGSVALITPSALATTPRLLLRLPVDTRVLAACWAVLSGIVAASVWLIFRDLVFAPLGFAAAASIPAITAAAFALTIQTVAWYSSVEMTANPYAARIVFMGFLPMAVPAAAFAAAMRGVPSPQTSAGSILWIVACAPLAVIGLTRMRRGEAMFRTGTTAAGRSLPRSEQDVAALRFRTPAAALEWLEWTTYSRWTGPWIALVLLAFVFQFVAIDHAVSIGDGYIIAKLGPAWTTPHYVGINQFSYNVIVLVTVNMLTFGTVVARRDLLLGAAKATGARARSRELYQTARPLTDLQWIAASLRSTVRTMPWIVGVTVPLVAIALTLPAKPHYTPIPLNAPNAPMPLIQLWLRSIAPSAPVQSTGILLAGLLTWLILLWRIQADTLFTRYIRAGGATFPICYPAMIINTGAMLAFQSVWETRTSAVMATVLAAFLVAKIAGIAVVIPLCLRRGVFTTGDLLRITRLWGVSALALFTLYALVIPSTWFPLWQLAAISVLLVPCVRLSLAPLLLRRWRHQ